MADPKVPGIYAIRNLTNGKVYVGSSADIYSRWRRHRTDLAKSSHHSLLLQRAWQKHEASAFVFDLLEVVEDRSLIAAREQHWMDTLQSSVPSTGYNVYPQARGTRGATVTEATRAKLSAAAKVWVRHPDTLAKLRIMRKGHKNTAEQNAKIAAANIGRRMRPEHLARLVAINTGKKLSLETIEKRSAAIRGVKRSAEAVAKIVAFHTGRKRSEETRAKIAAAARMRRHSADTKEKISIALKSRFTRPSYSR